MRGWRFFLLGFTVSSIFSAILTKQIQTNTVTVLVVTGIFIILTVIAWIDDLRSNKKISRR